MHTLYYFVGTYTYIYKTIWDAAAKKQYGNSRRIKMRRRVRGEDMTKSKGPRKVGGSKINWGSSDNRQTDYVYSDQWQRLPPDIVHFLPFVYSLIVYII